MIEIHGILNTTFFIEKDWIIVFNKLTINLMTQNKEILIHLKGVGFSFLVDKRMEYNLVSPALLSFFSFGKKKMSSSPDNNVREVNTIESHDDSLAFPPEYMRNIYLYDIFHYMGKKIGRCMDNKLRLCKIFTFEFEYEGNSFSFPFLLDKSLDKPAVLGRESLSHITKTVTKQI